MRFRRIFTILLVLVYCVYTMTACQRKQSPPPKEDKSEESSKGYIVYINTEASKNDVMYTADVSGKNKKKAYEKSIFGAAGHGEKIAFFSKIEDKQMLKTMKADGSDEMTIMNNIIVKNSYLSWSPDGKKIVFSAVYPLDKSSEIYYAHITKDSTPIKVSDDLYEDDHPKFSSDGKMIIFTKNINNNFDIHKFDIGAQNTINISNNTANDISPVMTPDGTRIIFLSDEKEKGKYNLYMMNMDGGARTELTSGLNIMLESIKISPDSGMVSFIAVNEKLNKTVHIIDMNKSTMMIADDAYMAEWSDDSKKLYYATFDPKNRKVVEYDIEGRTMKEVIKLEYKPGQESEGIKFLHFTGKLK